MSERQKSNARKWLTTLTNAELREVANLFGWHGSRETGQSRGEMIDDMIEEATPEEIAAWSLDWEESGIDDLETKAFGSPID